MRGRSTVLVVALCIATLAGVLVQSVPCGAPQDAVALASSAKDEAAAAATSWEADAHASVRGDAAVPPLRCTPFRPERDGVEQDAVLRAGAAEPCGNICVRIVDLRGEPVCGAEWVLLRREAVGSGAQSATRPASALSLPASVWQYHANGTTDASGMVVTQCASGWLALTASVEESGIVRFGQAEFGPLEPDHSRTEECRLGGGTAFRVRVLNDDGTPAHGLEVQAECAVAGANTAAPLRLTAQLTGGEVRFDGPLPPRMDVALLALHGGPARLRIPAGFRGGLRACPAVATCEPLLVRLLPEPWEQVVAYVPPSAADMPEFATILALRGGVCMAAFSCPWSAEAGQLSFTLPKGHAGPEQLVVILADGRFAVAPVSGVGIECQAVFGALERCLRPTVTWQDRRSEWPELQIYALGAGGEEFFIGAERRSAEGVRELPHLPYALVPMVAKQPHPSRRGSFLPFTSHAGAMAVRVAERNVWMVEDAEPRAAASHEIAGRIG